MLLGWRWGIAEQHQATHLSHERDTHGQHAGMTGNVKCHIQHPISGDLANWFHRILYVDLKYMGRATLQCQVKALSDRVDGDNRSRACCRQIACDQLTENPYPDHADHFPKLKVAAP